MELLKEKKPLKLSALVISATIITIIMTASITSHSSEGEEDYFVCAGKLLDVISSVRILVNTVDNLDYQKSKLLQCDDTVSDCERIASKVLLDTQILEADIENTKEQFLNTIDFCLNVSKNDTVTHENLSNNSDK